MIVLATLLFTIASCGGEKLLTEEEMAQQVEDRTNVQIDSLTDVLDTECEEKFDDLVATLRDSILTTVLETEEDGK